VGKKGEKEKDGEMRGTIVKQLAGILSLSHKKQ
jgi:hypothetical protein